MKIILPTPKRIFNWVYKKYNYRQLQPARLYPEGKTKGYVLVSYIKAAAFAKNDADY